jgi:predicted DNA-binding protein
MATTTIRVPIEVREKLAVLSDSEGKPIGKVIQKLIREHEKQEFFKGLAEDFRRLRNNPEAWAEYQREIAMWDTALMDGLENEPLWEDE